MAHLTTTGEEGWDITQRNLAMWGGKFRSMNLILIYAETLPCVWSVKRTKNLSVMSHHFESPERERKVIKLQATIKESMAAGGSGNGLGLATSYVCAPATFIGGAYAFATDALSSCYWLYCWVYFWVHWVSDWNYWCTCPCHGCFPLMLVKNAYALGMAWLSTLLLLWASSGSSFLSSWLSGFIALLAMVVIAGFLAGCGKF